MAPSFEVLPGLPATGPYPEQFSTKGGTFREGFVVRVIPDRTAPWVGNFQPGGGGISRVVSHPDGRTLLVISRGLAYPVDPESRSLVSPATEDCIQEVCVLGEQLALVGWSELTLLGPESRRWKSPPVATDGIKDVRIEGATLLASGWNGLDEGWQPIEIDLRTGTVVASAGEFQVVPPARRSLWQVVRRQVRLLLRRPGR
jgi:hypothetical protein